MEQNTANKLTSAQTHGGVGEGQGSDGDDTNLSPRSLEHLQNISSGISQLVDDIVSPSQDNKIFEAQMQSLTIGIKSEQRRIEPSSMLDKGYEGIGNHNNIEGAGMTPLPGYPQYGDHYQAQLNSGVGDFSYHGPSSLSKGKRFSGSQLSHLSSDGEASITNQHFEVSEQAVGHLSTTPILHDRYSMQSIFEHGSDYQEQLDKYGYIFQSPDTTTIRQQQPQQLAYQHSYTHGGGGYHQHHHHPRQQYGPQQRASSFDKVVHQNEQYYPSGQQLMPGGEEIETHSAASSGNYSAYSEGDLYKQSYQAPFSLGGGVYGQPQQQIAHGSLAMSNQAAYGLSPNVHHHMQGQNGKYPYYVQGTQQVGYLMDGTPYYYSDQINDELTPTGQQFQSDIQITGSEINLDRNYSPRKNNSDLKAYGGAKHQSYQAMPGQDFDFAQAQFNTPSPYRNNDATYQYGNQTAPPHLSSKVPRGSLHGQDPFFTQNMHNQRIPSYNNDPQLAYLHNQRAMMAQGHHIGMNVPPMPRGIDFSHHEAQLAMGHLHGGPMLATIQQQHQQQMINMQHHAQFRQHAPQPLKVPIKQTNSQERESSYQIPNFSTHAQGPNQFSRTVDNTPTHIPEGGRSVSSQNSSTSQQFAGLIMDHNETFLFSIIKQFDDAPNSAQRLDILKGNVHKLALTQTGSRFLQKQLTKANSNIVAFFLQEIGEHMSTLMVDNYGNYFCQRFLSSCSGDQRLAILKMISHRFIEICCNKKGTHTIQTMFDLVNLPEEEEFIKKLLTGNVLVLSQDPQGTHVIQKVLSTFEESKRQFVFDEVYEHFLEMAVNTNGLCVIKKLVSHTLDREQASRLMLKVADNVIELVQNPYGNYAVTEIINNWDTQICQPIFNKLKNKICQLSIQKFSSNVIERCLEKADPETRSAYICELSNSDKLASLTRNSYGNYVVQKALKLAEGEDRVNAIEAINKAIPQIPDRKIRTKWEKIIEEAQNSQPMTYSSSQKDPDSGEKHHRQGTSHQ